MDLKQVAERYRKTLNIHKPVSPAVILADAMAEELDPTPLTVEVLESLGFTPLLDRGDSPHSDWRRRFENYIITLEWNISDNNYITEGDMLPMRTVGELRTLARLAGVELKENKPGRGKTQARSRSNW